LLQNLGRFLLGSVTTLGALNEHKRRVALSRMHQCE
jgi:hypothetical protein